MSDLVFSVAEIQILKQSLKAKLENRPLTEEENEALAPVLLRMLERTQRDKPKPTLYSVRMRLRKISATTI